MTNRRTFLATAASAALLPKAAVQAQARHTRLRMKDSTELYVKEWSGSGRPVIFTHAWPLSADIWDHQAVALSNAGYRVISYGTADIPVPIALARATARGIPGAKIVEYDGLHNGVTHGLVVTEKDRVTRDLMTFLAG